MLGSYLLFSLVHPVVFREPVNDKYWHLADLISGMYLAAHYAGQTWGMVASFAYLGGVLIQKIERQVLRIVLLVFVAWHVAIANHLVPKYTLFVAELKPFLETLFGVIPPFAHVAMVVAIAVFVRIGYRIKRVTALGVGADPTSLRWVSGLYPRLCGFVAPAGLPCAAILDFPVTGGNQSQPH